MSIFNKKLHMPGDMHVYDDRGIIYNVMMQVLQIAWLFAQLYYSLY